MIIKPLKPTRELLQMEALDRRLPLTHPLKEQISTKTRNLRAGYNGEHALQFPLSFLPEDDFLIFHHLRLPDQQGHFQMDTLLLSTNYILIIEVKNIRDIVTFDDMGQTYREEADVIQGFTNPVDQVNLQHLRLLRWLRKFNLPSIPIEKIVTYTNPTTILKNLTNKKDLPKIVIHKGKLLDKIDEFSDAHPVPYISEEQLTDLSYELLVAHTDVELNVLSKYKIKKEELIKGVFCPSCAFAPMKRQTGKWVCLNCGKSSHYAHQTALVDYALLINEYINNQSARDFLQVDSSYIAKDLLQKEKFRMFGVTSGRKYRINFEL
ncbi:NERD domain-containing protein [Oceanobacillus sp. CAU 1775]